jgi:hypothetical protein
MNTENIPAPGTLKGEERGKSGCPRCESGGRKLLKSGRLLQGGGMMIRNEWRCLSCRRVFVVSLPEEPEG